MIAVRKKLVGLRNKLHQKLARLRVRLNPQKFYTKDYFLKNCSGGEVFLKSGGKKLIKKYQVALAMVKIREGMKILDVGCGRGEVTNYCHQQGAEVIGVDFSQEAIEMAQKAYPEVSFIHQDIFQYAPKTKFSLIIMLDFIEHIPRRKFETLLRKCHRWLDKEGEILIHTNEKKQEEMPGVPFHPEHINLLTAQELKNILNDHGFKIKEFKLRPREAEEFSGGIYCLAQKVKQ